MGNNKNLDFQIHFIYISPDLILNVKYKSWIIL